MRFRWNSCCGTLAIMLARLGVLLLVAGTTLLAAQPIGQSGLSGIRPDFSGTWVLSSTAPSAFRTSQWTPPVKMTQVARTLTLEYVSRGRNHAPVKLVYDLDGSEQKGVDRNGPSPYDLLLRAEWRGASLVLSTIYLREREGNIETTEVLALDSATSMTVESTRKWRDQTLTSTSRWRR